LIDLKIVKFDMQVFNKWRIGKTCGIICILSEIHPMRKLTSFIFFMFIFFMVLTGMSLTGPLPAVAKTPQPLLIASPSAQVVVSPPEPVKSDITQKTEEVLGPLESILKSQSLGPVWPGNPIKYAVRGAVSAGVPANTIVLLLLLPLVALIIAFSRNVIGIRGFGIFLPAALSVVFVATGPVVGIGLFMVIVVVSTATRMVLRRLKLKLQYLPRMSFILWAVVVGVLGTLFMAPYLRFSELSNVSIFAVLILVLLAEDFIRVQLGKSVKTALGLTFETLVLSLISYLFLTLKPLQEYVLLNPEVSLLFAGIADLILGKYTGLRIMEYYRFRKLINQ